MKYQTVLLLFFLAISISDNSPSVICIPGGYYKIEGDNKLYEHHYDLKNAILDNDDCFLKNNSKFLEIFLDLMLNVIQFRADNKFLRELLNDYYDEFINILEKQNNVAMCIIRESFVKVFSWSAIPKQVYTDISNVLKEHRITTIIDPFAGTGFMGKMFSFENFNVKLSDGRLRRITWLPIKQIDVEDYLFNDNTNDQALLLSWVDLNSDSGTIILNKFQGNYMIWVGEDKGGIVGNDEIYELIERDWKILKHFDYSQFPGVNDYVRVYVRKIDI